jgi:hypothetical protein
MSSGAAVGSDAYDGVFGKVRKNALTAAPITDVKTSHQIVWRQRRSSPTGQRPSTNGPWYGDASIERRWAGVSCDRRQKISRQTCERAKGIIAVYSDDEPVSSQSVARTFGPQFNLTVGESSTSTIDGRPFWRDPIDNFRALRRAASTGSLNVSLFAEIRPPNRGSERAFRPPGLDKERPNVE